MRRSCALPSILDAIETFAVRDLVKGGSLLTTELDTRKAVLESLKGYCEGQLRGRQ